MSSQSDEPLDPELQILAANALYRVAQHGPQDKTAVLKNLDTAIRAYAEALRSGNDRPDTAYNYELAVRLREEIGSGRRKGGLPNPKVDETKSDPNMHGDPGEPPMDSLISHAWRKPSPKEGRASTSEWPVPSAAVACGIRAAG